VSISVLCAAFESLLRDFVAAFGTAVQAHYTRMHLCLLLLGSIAVSSPGCSGEVQDIACEGEEAPLA